MIKKCPQHSCEMPVGNLYHDTGDVWYTGPICPKCSEEVYRKDRLYFVVGWLLIAAVIVIWRTCT